MTRKRLRPLVRLDLPRVLAIEKACFEQPINEQQLLALLRQKHEVAFVGELDDRVAGFAMWRIDDTAYHLRRLAVHPMFRRQGLGRFLLDKQYRRARRTQRLRLLTEVPDTLTGTHYFLAACGYVAVKVRRTSGPDLYLFERVVPLDDRLGKLEMEEVSE